MKALKRVWQAGIGILVAVALVIAPSCGSNDFLGLEDYQRDLLMGGLAVALLSPQAQGTTNGEQPAPAPVDGRDGVDGINCWDLNGNEQGDPAEDINGDGDYDALDCQGAQGAAGPAGTDGQDGVTGADGLSCWDLNGNGRGDASEDANGDGDFNALDCQGPAGPPGPAGSSGGSGPQGPPGADGPEFFDIFIDDFFTTDGAPWGNLPVVAVSIEEPALGVRDPYTGTTGIVAYRMAIPATYGAGNDVTMRLFFYQTGYFEEDCFIFTVDARRLRAGTGIANYGERRWVRVHTEEINGVTANGDVAPGIFLVVDLPVNTAAGLDFPNDLEVADFLAFELNTYRMDGQMYHLLGVEFFESDVGAATTTGATIFFNEDDVGCDCNSNGIDDACDVQCGEPGSRCDLPGCGQSDDCNENGIPDECDGGCPECITDYDCEDDDLCTVDICVQGECLHEPIECPEGSICLEGVCVTAPLP